MSYFPLPLRHDRTAETLVLRCRCKAPILGRIAAAPGFGSYREKKKTVDGQTTLAYQNAISLRKISGHHSHVHLVLARTSNGPMWLGLLQAARWR